MQTLAALGIDPSAVARPTADVWPEHRTVVEVLSFGPWRWGPHGGLIGLDSAQIRALMDLLGIEEEDWRGLMADLLVIESKALDLINK